MLFEHQLVWGEWVKSVDRWRILMDSLTKIDENSMEFAQKFLS